MRGGWTVAVISGVMALGCGGLMGYGDEQARTFVQVGVPFAVSYTPLTSEPHQVWIEYEVNHMGSDFGIDGDIVATPAGGSPTTWTMHLNSSDPPVSGPRLTMNETKMQLGLSGTASGTVWAVELPGVAAGTEVTVSGTWLPKTGTTPGGLQLIVTD